MDGLEQGIQEMLAGLEFGTECIKLFKLVSGKKKPEFCLGIFLQDTGHDFGQVQFFLGQVVGQPLDFLKPDTFGQFRLQEGQQSTGQGAERVPAWPEGDKMPGFLGPQVGH